MYQFDGKNWKDSHLDMKERREHHSCVLLDGEIMVVGGYDGSRQQLIHIQQSITTTISNENYIQTTEILSLENNSWRPGPVLRTGISWAQLVKSREGMKYAAFLIGGYDGSNLLTDRLTLMYGLTKDLKRFELIGNLKKARDSHVALSIPDNIIQWCDKI